MSAMVAEQFKIRKAIIMKMQFFRMQAILANKLCGLVNLLQMPFTQDGFEPLYPLLKSKKLAGFLGSDAHRTFCRPPEVQSGVKYLYSVSDRVYADDVAYRNAERLISCTDINYKY